MPLSRRLFIKSSAAVASAATFVGITGASGPGSDGTRSKSGRFFGYQPFSQDLFVPEVLTPLPVGTLSPTPAAIFARGPVVARGKSADVAHGIAPEFGLCQDWNQSGIGTTHAREYLLYTEETTQRFVPGGPDVPIFTYRDGTAAPGSERTPGPTIISDFLAPVVLRNTNLLARNRSPVNTTLHDHETSIHLHGTHAPAHADGYSSFYVLADEARDYYYPNIAPRVTNPETNFASVCDGPFDEAWIPTTLWYHDHAMDVTGFNVSRGLAGFYLVVDERERFLEATGVIPTIGGPQDIGVALADQQFNSDGTLHYDFLDHNGRLGDVLTVNGLVQPRFRVERRKYRFRFLNASNARVYEIRLSNRQKMCIIGTDSWLLPRGIEVTSFRLDPGQRHDVIIDLRDAPDDVYIENIMHQTDGRGAIGVDADKERDLLLKFDVLGDRPPSEVPCTEGSVLRGLAGIDPGGQWSATLARHSDAVAMASLTDEQLFLAIRDGGPAIGKSSQMGAWADVLSEAQIRQLVTYIRELAN